MSGVRSDNVAVADMVAAAIKFSAEKVGRQSQDEVLAALRAGDCTVCDYLRTGLANEIARYLGSVDDTIKAVYHYDPEHATSLDEPISERSHQSPGIHLIAWTSQKSAALASVISLLSLAVAEEHGRLGCPKANALCYRLNIQVVDDTEVNSRLGYGALINSLYVRPVQIWRR